MASCKNGDLTAYTDSYFTEPVSIKQVKSALEYEKIDDSGTDYMNANGLNEEEVLANQSLLPEEYWIREKIGPADIKEFRIKGMWYFDKRQGELKYRLLALCPAALKLVSRILIMKMIKRQLNYFGFICQKLDSCLQMPSLLIIKIQQNQFHLITC